MAKPPGKPRDPARPTRAKAAKPEVAPLAPHLVQLLNPALAPGFGEAPQAAYDASSIHGLDEEDIEKYGLGEGFHAGGGVEATADSLAQLLRLGDPNIRDQKPWTPHRPERPAKSEGGVRFDLVSEYTPKGDQPAAIAELVKGIAAQERDQVLLGVTGSGKTFTMASVIERVQRPALILAPNKTLAAQLYGEFKSFFPNNAVEYFVSYYDYYQPEAYVPRSDTYIEKESSVNEQIDRMRHAATRALLERDDVIIVASVSCIYGIGSVETYTAMTFSVTLGEKLEQRQLVTDLVALHYRRIGADFTRGTFRVRGDTVDIFPAHYEDRAWRISFFGDEVESISEFDPLTGKKTVDLEFVKVYANSHYVTPRPTLLQSIKAIKEELRARLDELHRSGRLVEAQRLEQRTRFDLEMMEATGSCAGVENYSRYLTGRRPGEPPPTLFEYLPGQCAGLRRREPRQHSADRRDVQGRLPPQGDARGIWIPSAVLHGQSPAALRGMGRDAAADRFGLGDAGKLGAQSDRRRLRRTGDSPDGIDRPARRGAPGARPGRRSSRRSAGDRADRLSLACHRAHQAHGGRSDRISA